MSTKILEVMTFKKKKSSSIKIHKEVLLPCISCTSLLSKCFVHAQNFSKFPGGRLCFTFDTVPCIMCTHVTYSKTNLHEYISSISNT